LNLVVAFLERVLLGLKQLDTALKTSVPVLLSPYLRLEAKLVTLKLRVVLGQGINLRLECTAVCGTLLFEQIDVRLKVLDELAVLWDLARL
jgi:hypothetical protein